MNWKKWRPYLLSICLALAVGGLSALLSAEGMERYTYAAVKPPLTPPGWLFSAVWTILYALMGISAARIWLARDTPLRSVGLNLYALQLIVNYSGA